MSCKVKTLSLETLRERGVVSDTREILNISEFNKVNQELTDFAFQRYGVGNGKTMLFDTRSAQVRYPFGGGSTTITRYDANNKLFDILQDAVDTYKKDFTFPIFDNNKLDELLDDTLGEKLVVTPRERPLKTSEGDGNISRFILFNGETKSTYSATEILGNIISNFNGFSNKSEEFIKLARTLIVSSGAKIQIVESDELQKDTAFMEYSASKNIIYVSLENIDLVSSERAIKGMLHELVHSVTVSAYRNPITLEQRMFKEFIDNAFNSYKNSSKNKDLYGFEKPEEFISEVMTNELFQNELRDIDGNNIWKQFVDFIRTLFGINSSYNQVVNAILNIIPSEQSIDEQDVTEDFLFTEKETEKEDIYTNLKTIEDKVDYAVARIQESLTLNLQKYKHLSQIQKNQNKKENIEKHIATLQTLQNDIAQYNGVKKIQGIVLFTKSMMSNLEYIQNSLNRVDVEDEDSIMHSVSIYKNYLDTYTVVNDMQSVVNNLENDKTQDLLSAVDLEKLRKNIMYSKGQFEYLNGKIFTLMKQGMKFKLNDIKYFPQVEKKHRERLRKEFKASKIPGDENTWVMDKMLGRDSDLIQEDLTDFIDNLLENPFTDIGNSNVLWNSSVNVGSSFVQIMNQMLIGLDNERIATERLKDKEFEKMFNELKAEKGSSNINTLYKNILEFDKNGKPLLKGKYKADFYTEVHLKIKALRAKQREETNKKRLDIAELAKVHGRQSAEYQTGLKELTTMIKSGIKEIKSIEEANLDYVDGKFSKIKDKWLSDRSTLSPTERKVLDFFDDIVTTSHKQTYGQSSLITFSYGTRYLELPKITKSDTERLFTGNAQGIVKDRIDNFTKTRPDDIGYTVRKTGLDNEQLYSLKVHYRNQTGEFDNNQQSLDLMTIMRLEYKNGNMYNIRKKVEMDLNFLLDIAKSKDYYEKSGTTKVTNWRNKKLNTISGKETNTVKMMTNILENRFYDIMNHSNTKIGKVDLNKAVGFINKFSAFFTLTFNIASGTANVVNANAQLFLESFLSGQHIKANNIRKANANYARDMGNNIQDIRNPINLSYTNQLNELFNIRGIFNLTNSNFIQDNYLKAGLDSNSLQVFQETGEHWMQSVIAQAVLYGVKVMNGQGKFIDVNGKVVNTEDQAASIIDMTIKDPVTGILATSDKVVYTTHSRLTKYNEGGKEKLDLLIRKKLYDSIGNYTETDQPEIMRHWQGKLVMLYRKYLVPMGVARLKGIEYSIKRSEDLDEDERSFSYALQEYEEGTYTSLIRFIATGIKDKKLSLMAANWANLSEYEKHNIKRSVVEAVTIFAVLPLMEMLVMGLAGNGDDDDQLVYFAAYQLRRLETELSQYMSISESYKILRSPIPSARLLETAATVVLGAFRPSSYFEVYDRGQFKGENKWKIKVQKQIPIVKEVLRDYEALHNYQDNLFGKGL